MSTLTKRTVGHDGRSRPMVRHEEKCGCRWYDAAMTSRERSCDRHRAIALNREALRQAGKPLAHQVLPGSRYKHRRTGTLYEVHGNPFGFGPNPQVKLLNVRTGKWMLVMVSSLAPDFASEFVWA